MSQASVTTKLGNVTRKVRSVTAKSQNVTPDLFSEIAHVTRNLAVEHIWTIGMVSDRLVAAVRLCNRVAGSVMPSERAVFWPQILRGWEDLMMSVESEPEQEPVRRRATAREVSLMEASIGWLGRFLGGEANDTLRCVLALWLRCKARRGARFSEELKRRRWSKSWAYRMRDRALLLIAIGLMKEGTKP